MKQLGQKLLIFVIGSLIVDGICAATVNVMNGKDIFGRDPDPRKTVVDAKGHVHLGTDDYQVE